MADSRRVYQIAERIRQIVASQLQHVADPRFGMITITSVVVSPDLRNAKVYWVAHGADQERQAEILEAFKSAAGLFKRKLAKELGIRFVPNLRFYYDDTLDVSNEVDLLLARARAQGTAAGE